MLSAILGWLSGSFIKEIAGPLERAWEAKLKADTDDKRLAAEQVIKSIETAREIALAEAADRWSAVRVGRWLIVIPWGAWWSLIYAVSIINPLFGTDFAIHAVPAEISSMAKILIPAILIGDAYALTRRFPK